MATTYVVLREQRAANSDDNDRGEFGIVAVAVDAPNASTACRKVAEGMPADDLDGGVTLIAVPARNWNGGRHTLKAETQRRIRSS